MWERREEREREKHKVSITEGAGGGPAEPHSAKMRVGAVAAVKPHPAALAPLLAPVYTLPF